MKIKSGQMKIQIYSIRIPTIEFLKKKIKVTVQKVIKLKKN